MGISTDGQLSYGVVFGEEHKFPWDAEEFEGGYIEEWWMAVKGYANTHYYPFTKDGYYKEDAPVLIDKWGNKSLDHSNPKIQAYYDHRRAWLASNPLPVQLVNYCSGDYPMYLVAVKHIECSRGYPTEIDPAFLEVSEEEKQSLRDFLNLAGLEANEPKWWLTSYWG